MKKLFTLFLGIMLAFGAFSQAPTSVLYLTSTVPWAEGANDQFMFDVLQSLGYQLTTEKISATSATTGYDCAFASEVVGSGDAGWKTYKTTPLPMVISKVYAIKAPALGWIATEVSNVDYGNTTDSMYTKINDHPIARALPDSFQVCTTTNGTPDGAIAAWLAPFPGSPAGVTYVYRTIFNTNRTVYPCLAAIEPGTVLNGNTLTNRAVIVGIHAVSYHSVNDFGKRVLKNSIQWAVTGDVILGLEDQTAEVQTKIFPSPSAGLITLNFDKYVTSAQVSVLALDGRLMKTAQIRNTDLLTMDLSDLNNGLYIVNIAGSGINYTQNISLQK